MKTNSKPRTPSRKAPELFILAGPNGAGKTTCSKVLVPKHVPFINADEIAKEFSYEKFLNPDIQASRKLLGKISEFEKQQKSFAIETTLASRSLLSRIKRLQKAGVSITLMFLWLPSVDLAIDRVMERVRQGGHSIPSTVIKRRYLSGLSNFFILYKDIVDGWLFYDNSSLGNPKIIAAKENGGVIQIFQKSLWKKITQEVRKNGNEENIE